VTRGLVLALVLVLVPVPGLARAPVEAPATEDPLAEAKAAHADADAKYNTADYEGAIESWQRAYAALPRTAESNTYRSLILYNIAAAHEKLFQLRDDVEYLEKAKILLERFERSIDEIYAEAPEDGEKERVQVREKIARIDELIAAARREPTPEPSTPPPSTSPAEPVDPPTDAPTHDRRGRGWIIGGSVLTALGVGSAATMVAMLAIGERANDVGDLDRTDLQAREDQFDEGRRANAVAIATGVLAAALVGTGIALIVVGAKKHPRRTALTPTLGPSLTGLFLHGRF